MAKTNSVTRVRKSYQDFYIKNLSKQNEKMHRNTANPVFPHFDLSYKTN